MRYAHVFSMCILPLAGFLLFAYVKFYLSVRLGVRWQGFVSWRQDVHADLIFFVWLGIYLGRWVLQCCWFTIVYGVEPVQSVFTCTCKVHGRERAGLLDLWGRCTCLIFGHYRLQIVFVAKTSIIIA